MQHGDDGHILGGNRVRLVHKADALVLVDGPSRLVQLSVEFCVGVVRDVVAHAGVHEGLQEVVHDGVVCGPAAEAKLEVAGDVVIEHRRVFLLVDGHVDAHRLPVALQDFALVRLVGGSHHDGELNPAHPVGACGITCLVKKLVGLVDVVAAVLPRGLVVALDSRRDDVACGLSEALVQRVAEVLAVNGKRHCLANPLVGEDGVVDVVREVLRVQNFADHRLLFGGGGVAVVRLAVLFHRLLDAPGRDVANVEVAGLKLAKCRGRVFVDVKADGVAFDGPVADIALIARHVDVLAVVPGAIHLEGAIAHGRLGVRVEVVLGAVGNGREGRAGHDEGEVGVGLVKFNLEGVIVGARNTLKLLGFSVYHVVIALDHCEVIRDHGRRHGGLGVAKSVPSVLERLGRHIGAVVELEPLLDAERPRRCLIGRLPRLGNAGLELFRVIVIDRELVEEL